MSIYTAVKVMLQTMTTVADADITYGQRNQTSATFPCLTYLVDSIEDLSLGSTPLRKCTLTIKVYSLVSALEAVSISADVVTAVATGTFDSIVFQGVAQVISILDEPTSGDGEETNPFICTTTAQIYYQA